MYVHTAQHASEDEKLLVDVRLALPIPMTDADLAAFRSDVRTLLRRAQERHDATAAAPPSVDQVNTVLRHVFDQLFENPTEGKA